MYTFAYTEKNVKKKYGTLIEFGGDLYQILFKVPQKNCSSFDEWGTLPQPSRIFLFSCHFWAPPSNHWEALFPQG